QAVDTAFVGSPFAGQQQFTSVPLPPLLQQPTVLNNGVFQFYFTNQNVQSYEIWATTNLTLPPTSWDLLGLPTPLGGGLYQFTDSAAPFYSRRYYLLRQQ